jgi:hypothetical protein
VVRQAGSREGGSGARLREAISDSRDEVGHFAARSAAFSGACHVGAGRPGARDSLSSTRPFNPICLNLVLRYSGTVKDCAMFVPIYGYKHRAITSSDLMPEVEVQVFQTKLAMQAASGGRPRPSCAGLPAPTWQRHGIGQQHHGCGLSMDWFSPIRGCGSAGAAIQGSVEWNKAEHWHLGTKAITGVTLD